MAGNLTFPQIARIIKRNMSAFKKADVLTVRPGYLVSGGWITSKRGIVVTVNQKLANPPSSEVLPADVEGVPVDVREATGVQRLRQQDPAAYELAQAHMRSEFREPAWSDEHNVKTGKPVAAPPKSNKTTLKHMTKPEVSYTPATVPLSAVTASMTIIAYATPDAQNTPLKTFLAGTATSLTIAMYDFTSAELLDAVEKAIGTTKAFKMVLDHPPLNQTANQPDDQTRDDILAKAPQNAQINWALTRNDPVATKWIFPTAYHIKVAVRDSNTMWLSSGNFNVSNQPDLSPNSPPHTGSLANADRDWHLIIAHPGLAQVFEAFIDHDFSVAAPFQSDGDAALHAKIKAAMAKLAKAQAASSKPSASGSLASFSAGKPQTFENVPVTIQPLLTPDMDGSQTLYVEMVTRLIDGAKTSFYMQTQYIHPSDKAGDKVFMTLIAAVQAAMKRGVDVRLITSQYENTAQWIEKIKPFGIDEVLRIQQRVHNKGIVVDGTTVMVSSQNWSADGCLRNRDAGVIIQNEAIAKFFTAVFMDDWTTRASQKLHDAARTSPARAAAKKTGSKTGVTKKSGATKKTGIKKKTGAKETAAAKKRGPKKASANKKSRKKAAR